MLGLQNEREWASFCKEVLRQPELVEDARFHGNARRNENRDALFAIIVRAFEGLTTAMITERLDMAQIANAKVNNMCDVWRHPQLDARHRWRSIDTPVGPVPALLPPGLWMLGEPQMGPVPELGEHTRAILLELGETAKSFDSLNDESSADVRQNYHPLSGGGPI